MTNTANNDMYCIPCERRFQSPYKFNEHIRDHLRQKCLNAYMRYIEPYICSKCPKTFKRREDLHVHYQTHIPQPAYICTLCNQVYKHQEVLNTHTRMCKRSSITEILLRNTRNKSIMSREDFKNSIVASSNKKTSVADTEVKLPKSRKQESNQTNVFMPISHGDDPSSAEKCFAYNSVIVSHKSSTEILTGSNDELISRKDSLHSLFYFKGVKSKETDFNSKKILLPEVASSSAEDFGPQGLLLPHVDSTELLNAPYNKEFAPKKDSDLGFQYLTAHKAETEHLQQKKSLRNSDVSSSSEVYLQNENMLVSRKDSTEVSTQSSKNEVISEDFSKCKTKCTRQMKALMLLSSVLSTSGKYFASENLLGSHNDSTENLTHSATNDSSSYRKVAESNLRSSTRRGAKENDITQKKSMTVCNEEATSEKKLKPIKACDEIKAYSMLEKNYACDVCSKLFTRKCVLDVHRKKHFEFEDEKALLNQTVLIKSPDSKKSEKKSLLTRKTASTTVQETCIKGPELSLQDAISYRGNHKESNASKEEDSYKLQPKTRASNRRKSTIPVKYESGEYTSIPTHAVHMYTCLVCLKSFKDSYKLKRHNLIHSGNKPYVCSTCNKGFTRKDHLKRHSFTYCKNTSITDSTNVEGPFTCTACHIDFASKVHLKKHSAIHAAKQPHVCKKCGKGFIRKYRLTRHLSSCNGNNSSLNI